MRADHNSTATIEFSDEKVAKSRESITSLTTYHRKFKKGCWWDCCELGGPCTQFQVRRTASLSRPLGPC